MQNKKRYKSITYKMASKKNRTLHRLMFFLCCGLFICCSTAIASPKVLNIYAWTNYVPNEVLQQFSKETGIKVHLAEYDSNETMYAKLKASPQAGYDVIIPSSYFIERMIHQNMLTKIDLAKIPNIKNLNPAFLHQTFDPHNEYSLPYLWGATGIVVNTDYIDPKNVQRWQDLWQEQFKNQLMMINDIRDVFGIVLLELGYPINDKNPEHIKQAYIELKKLLPNIKIFNSDAEQTIYIDEDAILGMGYNGDIHLTQQENPKVKFIYPKEGFIIWIDNLAITKNAPNEENAYKFINFLLRPDIAKAIMIGVGYTSPNIEAIKLMPKEIQTDPTVNPTKEILRHGHLQDDLGEAMPVYEKYWELLKVGA